MYLCTFRFLKNIAINVTSNQDAFSANPGLKFNPLVWFVYFSASVYLKTSENKTFIDPEYILFIKSVMRFSIGEYIKLFYTFIIYSTTSVG